MFCRSILNSSTLRYSGQGTSIVNRINKACFSVEVAAVQNPLATFRTVINNPVEHTLEQEGRFYTILDDVRTKLFPFYGIPKMYADMIKMFNETCIMVRRPALEIIGYLERTNFSVPAVRYLIYGEEGVGKSMTLSHVLHYAFTKEWFILHSPLVVNWTLYPKDHTPSVYNPERIDTPLDAAVFLQQFRSQNGHLLQQYNVRVSKKYEWSKREVTEEGEPLLSVIEHGVNRMKHASDCAAVVMKEIKQQSQTKGFKVMVVSNGVNAFFTKTKIQRPDKSMVPIKDITVCRAFMKLLQNDWVNSCVVGACAKMFSPPDLRESFFPRYLLGKDGFELLEPLVPVLVQNYTRKEVDSCLDYYTDRLWIQSPAGQTDKGRSELRFLSGHHPMTLMNLCSSW